MIKVINIEYSVIVVLYKIRRVITEIKTIKKKSIKNKEKGIIPYEE